MASHLIKEKTQHDVPLERMSKVHRSPSMNEIDCKAALHSYPPQYDRKSDHNYHGKNPNFLYEEMNHRANSEENHQLYHEMHRPQSHSQWGQPNRLHPPSYHPHYPTSTQVPHQIHSVVSTSFSVDEDMEDQHIGGSINMDPPRSYVANRNEGFSNSSRGIEPAEELHDHMAVIAEDRRQEVDEPRDAAPPPNRVGTHMIPPSPQEVLPDGIHRSESSSSTQLALKRSFWHHSKMMTDQHKVPPTTHLDFLPPKRVKYSEMPGKEVITLAPRVNQNYRYHDTRTSSSSLWYNRPCSWGETHSDSRHHSYTDDVEGFTPTLISTGRPIMYPRGERFQSVHFNSYDSSAGFLNEETRQESFEHGDTSGEEFRHSSEPQFGPQHVQPPRNHDGISRTRGGPVHASGSGPEARNDSDTPRRTFSMESSEPRRAIDFTEESSVRREITFDSSTGEHTSIDRPDVYSTTQKSLILDSSLPGENSVNPSSSTESVALSNMSNHHLDRGLDSERETHSVHKKKKNTLLAQSEDRISLSETLCTIRENIEVFIANAIDVDAPAPGRKHPVIVGQVGLRCIHCRHITNFSDRVKRAVCYPSSIKRIYRTVIDMKLDHFQYCTFVPTSLKDRLNELKASNSRSTGTTMQYFVKAAKKIGMIDAISGVRLDTPSEEHGAEGSTLQMGLNALELQTSPAPGRMPCSSDLQLSQNALCSPLSPKCSIYAGQPLNVCSAKRATEKYSIENDSSDADFVGKIVLRLAEDEMALSPLRCFLRENVCAFSATEEDIAVRTPTNFSVVKGQVGIGCIHCLSLPAKDRSNRAVCFPFSIARIYQSVADIQRFHLGECKMVPKEIRDKFLELQSASSKGSKGLATRQYWVTSARKIGLIDSTQGIKFCWDPARPSAPAISLDILAQVASNATTSSQKLVQLEDKPCIAEFLYVVMDQLQSCRFTEADRNKRRLKNVGCLGVECRHCARQVNGRKFFWSSVNAVESNFVSVHTHMMECRMVPNSLKTRLANLKTLRREQTSRLRTGSQKAFFSRVWQRLHEKETAQESVLTVSLKATSSEKIGTPPRSLAI